jgi:hypothetical protein
MSDGAAPATYYKEIVLTTLFEKRAPRETRDFDGLPRGGAGPVPPQRVGAPKARPYLS